MQEIQLWSTESTYKKIKLDEPKLASWNANSDPEQRALQRYLDDIKQRLEPLPLSSRLYLHMEIDVRQPEKLLHHHDLDNYLYPVVQRLGASHFTLVSAIKRAGGGSYLQIGQAKPINASPEKEGWTSFQHDTRGVSIVNKEWKGAIRDSLQDAVKAHQIDPLKPGAVELQLVWKCSSERNWISLWKPTIDAMGPVLGEKRPFNPNDDSIVSLMLHLNTNNSIGWSVQIGMMWRPVYL
jgi:hypothetical protein